ncbi:hypothetical protein B0H67DRAFT_570426 [Lasiosphaeris hirsuta]|uniref:Letm1 RBD domain-containing protein n=1 Tax=Lasiosphaeris hirsuta TaxID=260670 RepID=A0AA40B0H2_9PEZI|nr:hypothetical protein B0H67DRAFT_570426 [Lasiosphaeris hirsuta]
MRQDVTLGILRLCVSPGRALSSSATRLQFPSARFLTHISPLRYYSSQRRPSPFSPTKPLGKTVASTLQDAANPPPTTRPPPLDLPERKPETSTFSHLFHTGKAYLTFYKNGLKQIYTNHRLLYPKKASDPIIEPGTRAYFLLRRRWAHDIRRLPLFAFLLLVCGEFTPLIVLAVPSLVPATCRIPKQAEKVERQADSTRLRYLNNVKEGKAHNSAFAVASVAQAFGVISSLWGRLPFSPPTMFSLAKLQPHCTYLVEDNYLLGQAGGVEALIPEEVKLACVARAISVSGRGDKELRRTLAEWLEMINEVDDQRHKHVRMHTLALVPREAWSDIRSKKLFEAMEISN